ncbi:glycoside hydrolase family 130 protein [Aquisphaera insulae]|uniref:glycoside hydrolase family 130 protein n=1 Tax=Aquisphaera insulae TaxID=2712864 RepID=UPI0013EB60AB|nr:glycoside hydrolase family 130 protein [Aquisphaera insulae]
MVLTRLYEKKLLDLPDIPPTREDLEVVGVFNPGAVLAGDEVVLLVRVAERPRETRPGFTGLPRWTPAGAIEIDWVPDAELEPVDPRVVRRKSDGLIRLTFTSHLRVVRCGDGRGVVEVSGTRFDPASELEEYGVEDPRITILGGRTYFTYVAVSRHGAATALAVTDDFRGFTRLGTIFCSENKDVVLFPERVAGGYVALHRPTPASAFCRPEMWIARSPDLVHWGKHDVLHGGGADWETGRVGAGPPPVRVDEGWLEIYHGSRRSEVPGEVGTYSTGLLLLDADHPSRILRRTPHSVFEPTAEFERRGFVPNVVFPTGIVDTGPTYLVYYGAADTCTGVVEFSKDEVFGELGL